MLYVENGILYRKTISPGGADIVEYISLDKRIILSVDKAIVSDGIDKAVIIARLRDWQDVNINMAAAVRFEVNGIILDRVMEVQGETSIEFTSLTPGIFEVVCSCPGFDAGLVEVVADEA